MSATIDALATRAGVSWLDHQQEALEAAELQAGPAQRRCLYHRTGAGKSLLSLAMMAGWGATEVLVIAPPSTHVEWQEQASRFGMTVTTMSHAKFRMPGTKLGRHTAVIADEFHQFGGAQGKGFVKLERLAKGLQAPMILASATPNYNDAERVYCIQRILDPMAARGGILQFIYTHCTTEQNQFGPMPIVTGFHKFKDAEEFLASLPGVDYLPDELVFTIDDVEVWAVPDQDLNRYGYNPRKHRVIASQIEERHTRTLHSIVDVGGMVHFTVLKPLFEIIDNASTPVLIYCNHSTIAEALALSFEVHSRDHYLITGDTTKKKKEALLADFKRGETEALIGTASLATGTDGLDKVSDTLIILDDTEDDSLRRQLIGRIMPRGLDTDATGKQVFRFVFI